MRRLTILHTNDFHSHLTPAKAAAIRERRAMLGEPSVLLDAGDAVSAGNVGVRLGGEPILELMNETGYDAMTLGNREFHVSDAVIRHKIGKATFPVLSANMRYRDDRGETLPVTRSMVKNYGDVRVGVFGLTVPMVTDRMAARHLSAYLFDDALGTAKIEIQRLRGDCDVLVLLSHVGYKSDQKLAAACPELDLIVGGHSHVVLEEPDRSHGVPIVQAGWYAKYLGIVRLEESGSRFDVVSAGLEPLLAHLPAPTFPRGAGPFLPQREDNGADR